MLSVGGEICIWKEDNLSIVLKWRDHFDLKKYCISVKKKKKITSNSEPPNAHILVSTSK